MPSIKLKVSSFTSKFWLKRRLQSLLDSPISDSDPYGVVSRWSEAQAPAIPSFSGEYGVATKDLHIDPLSSLSIRIFLPKSAVVLPITQKVRDSAKDKSFDNGNSEKLENGAYGGYSPDGNRSNYRKLPVILQFHGGIWVTGGNNTVANDGFCRRLANLCDAIVVAVGYRLAPESKFPAAFEDGLKVLNWLGMQANLAECNQPLKNGRFSGSEREGGGNRRLQIVDGFLSTMIEPWLAAHGDPSRCVLLGVGCGANIANYVAKNAVEAGKLLDPITVVAQVLITPFFMGSIPMDSEIKLANSYIYDKATSLLAWKLFLPEEDFKLDHPVANPLVGGGEVPLKCMPPTLIIVAEHDWMRDRAIAYCQELRKVNVDSPLLDYKDTVHEFVTLGSQFKTPVAQACSEDIAIWMKKYISVRGNEFSY